MSELIFRLITPPYGLSLLMASKFCDFRFTTAMYASLPLYLVFFGTIAFCIFFPDVVLWLPKQVLPESVGCFRSPTGEGYICPWSRCAGPPAARSCCCYGFAADPAEAPLASSWFTHQSIDLPAEDGEAALDDVPDHLMVDPGIAMRQNVTQRDDATVVRDRRHLVRVEPRELTQRLADDFELALDSRAEQGIGT